MPFGAFVAITIFIFLAILGGVIGIILEGRRMPPGGDNPATRDTVFPIVGWASLFVLYLALLFVRDEDMRQDSRRSSARSRWCRSSMRCFRPHG